MPKYVRTKDEILKALDTDYMCGVKVYHTEKGMITEKLVVNTADTLAELCDEFVIVDLLGNEKPLLIIKSVVKEMMRMTKTQIYGAIWCEWGLKYVAKMNESGNLELL